MNKYFKEDTRSISLSIRDAEALLVILTDLIKTTQLNTDYKLLYYKITEEIFNIKNRNSY